MLSLHLHSRPLPVAASIAGRWRAVERSKLAFRWSMEPRGKFVVRGT